MEYGLGKLEEMSRIEYGAANKDELVWTLKPSTLTLTCPRLNGY